MTAVLIPPINYGMVENGIYRSGFPRRENLTFLDTLKLKTVVCLSKEPYPPTVQQFLEGRQIKQISIRVGSNKQPSDEIPYEPIYRAMLVILEKDNHPILVHCNKGKHRTGCLIGAYRRYRKWSLTSVFDEYRMYAGAKERSLDQQFIELFDLPRTLDANGVDQNVGKCCASRDSEIK